MTDERKAELTAKLLEKGKEVRALVGDDLPKGGYVSINVWADTIGIDIIRSWESIKAGEEKYVLEYWELLS